MSLEPTLLSMPGVVKDQLFQYLSYIDIARLHKTCKDLRDYINVSRPDARFHIIDISQYNGSVYLNLITKNKKDSVELEYKKSEQGCSILSSVGFRNVNFRNINGLEFMAAFCRDLEMVLRHQKSILKEVEVCQYSEKIYICETI
ncbi:hypothetical protein GCK72_021397 [Caenorhabditis remanei]|uniref:F-box domain-containing protein n=1 Tax=Caenorhabditis remanei TaxID=31234 RepID=A0A6A5GK01_CAERE|nr:hypothetical protein GCK72_021397 [Caenorhabditis remanei]KAF1754832.1 hypothetical protein GCK72_021397 [Caenorhabditis remanei]